MSKQSSVQAKSTISPGLTRSSASLMERQPTLGPHVCVQREAVGPAIHPAAPSLVRQVVDSPGRPLDAATRSEMEPRFGYDFSRVRVHNDDRAAESARAVSANAYTAGLHVVFGAGRYTPSSPAGQRLIAHELTHVVQQASGPVEGTPAGGGLSISHPADRFERRAAKATELPANSGDGAAPIPQCAQSQSEAGVIHVQRQDAPDTPSGRTSARAGVASAAFGGVSALGSLVSAYEAVRQANFAERSAQAAEDPPVAEPITGGVASNHVELVEVKGYPKGIHGADYEETSVEKEHTISKGYPIRGAEVTDETKTNIKKGPSTTKTITEKSISGAPTSDETSKLIEKTVTKDKDTPDQEKQVKVLGLFEGSQNAAEFLLTLRYNGTDVRGGATEDGKIAGYLGGSNESNASVTFRASPGKHLGTGVATERLLFGGSNVPPRKTMQSQGFFSVGSQRAVENKNYKVQRFSGSFRCTGDGGVGLETLRVTPFGPETKVNQTGDGKETPVVTIKLNSMDTAAPAMFPGASFEVLPMEPSKGGGEPPPPTGGGGK